MLVCTLYHKKGLKSALNEVFANANKKSMFRHGYQIGEGKTKEIPHSR